MYHVVYLIHKATKIHTLRPVTYEIFFQNSSIMVRVCVVHHYHIRVEIHQMAQTHKKVNEIHSVDASTLKDRRLHAHEKDPSPSSVTPLSAFNLSGFIFTG